MNSYNDFVLKRRETLRQTIAKCDPNGISKALDLPKIPSSQKSSRSAPSLKESMYSLSDSNNVDWSSLFKSFCEAYFYAKTGNIADCFEAQAALHSSMNTIFSSSSGNYLVPSLHTVCSNTHRVALAADGVKTNDHSKLQNAVTLLQDSFSKCLNDRKEFKPGSGFDEEGSKKAGVLYIVNHLFSMYFSLNTLRLCRNLVLPVEKRALHSTGVPMGQQVTYRYYVGRLNMYEDQYELAEMNLSFAFQHCHKDAVKNKKKILNFLLPVKLLRGRFPTNALLEKYALQAFIPLVKSIRTGDLKTFHAKLYQFQDLFIRQGTYLLFEKCKAICYRNLFKQIHHIFDKKTQIPLTVIVQTFKYLEINIDLDEVECILANLIYKSFMRGYISHTKRILVLSKKDPFPLHAVIPK